MKNAAINDSLFREAVEAIDAGNVITLQRLLNENPRLVKERLDLPMEGYFRNPYLLWFVADNPIRHDKLPANIVDVTRLVIDYAKREAVGSFQEQLDYALGLVATGRIPKECGVQLALMDLLIDAGAIPGNGHGALAHGNIEAANRLLERGGTLTLTTAIGLDRTDDVMRLLKTADSVDLQIALVAAAFFGKADMIKHLIDAGADVNVYIDSSSGFHSHASALHQAVYSRSLDSVKILVEAGANLHATDRGYQGTPLGWAMYMQTEEGISEAKKKKFREIEIFLKEKGAS